MGRLLFSFRGRVGRLEFWLMALLSIPFYVGAKLMNGGFAHDPTESPGILLLLPTLWPAFAVTVKRWHDRDKSGWWMLINLIPLVGAIWSLIETGFLRGTDGDNRFGPEAASAKN
jgi:uncharacterized membrane protein YhaH (DUF805 family)